MNEKRYFYITPEDYATARENGISEESVYQRVYKQDWDIDRAVTEPINTQYHKTGIWDEWRDKAVVGYKTFQSRMHLGWSAEKAALTPRTSQAERNRARSSFTEEQLAIAESNGISRGVLSQRFHSYKWPMEKAITTPVMSKNEAAKNAVEARRRKKEVGA